MPRLEDEVRHSLQQLLGLKLSRTALAADMRTIQFGVTTVRSRGGVVGQYALHIQCPWRLENDAGVITGSDDLYVPYEKKVHLIDSFDWEKGGSYQDGVLRKLLQGYDETTKQIVNTTNLFIVEAVQADSSGGFCLTLTAGFRFLVFPYGTNREAWRLFSPSKDRDESNEQHFVVPREN